MKTKLFYLLTSIILFVQLAISFSVQLRGQCTNIHPDDLAALQALYRSTDGDHWTDNTGWDQIMNSTSPAICDLTIIHGLTFTGDRVSYIRLNSNNLNGNIPASLGDLISLQNVDFQLNNLIGYIPEALGRLTNLTFLRLSYNNLSGFIPAELGNISRLRILNISNNNLSGHIPRSLVRLTNLYRLALNSNNLRGIIPRYIGRMHSLEEIYLGNNKLGGPIPRELGNLFRLRVLELQANQLIGGIPSSLSRLLRLEDLNLARNRLIGTVPSWLGNLTSLESLNLGANRFRGTIPSQLGNLTSLYSLTLSSNMLLGHIPVELGNLSNLFYLFLSDNMLTGPIPGELGNLTSLLRLYLQNNGLSGCFHPNLRNLCGIDVFLDDAEFDVPWADFCDGLGGVCDPESCNDTIRYFPDFCVIPREKIIEFGLANADCRVADYTLTDVDGNFLPDTLLAQNGDYCDPVLLTYTCEDGTTCVIQIEISSDFSTQEFVSMSMQEYLSGTALYSVRGCPGIYIFEDEALFHSCELTRIKRTWRYTGICGHAMRGIQYIDIQDYFFCRFVGPFRLPEGSASWIRLDLPENVNLKGIQFDWSVKSRDWKVLDQKGPAILVRPGRRIAVIGVRIHFPAGLALDVQGKFVSYMPGIDKLENPDRLNLPISEEVIKVYPNPSRSEITVLLLGDLTGQQVQVINHLGKVVSRNDIHGDKIKLSVVDWSPGVYTLRLSDGKSVVVKRFIKM